MIASALEATGVIAIIRGIEGANLDRLAAALYSGGIRLAEVTMNTRGAAQAISRLRKKYDGDMKIGAGTVTDISRAKEALDAGAQFVVTPNVNEEVIRLCIQKNVFIAPGALTPTEVANAMNLGCEYVKLFPAGNMGPSYIKDLSAPLSGVKLIAVGGIGVDNAAEYIKNGAVGIGVGGGLCKTPEDGNYSAISGFAAKLIDICRPKAQL